MERRGTILSSEDMNLECSFRDDIGLCFSAERRELEMALRLDVVDRMSEISLNAEWG